MSTTRMILLQSEIEVGGIMFKERAAVSCPSSLLVRSPRNGIVISLRAGIIILVSARNFLASSCDTESLRDGGSVVQGLRRVFTVLESAKVLEHQGIDIIPELGWKATEW
jgi:hypothetical protein